MHKLTWLILALFFINSPIFANTKNINNPLTTESFSFDVTTANKDFDKMNLNLSTQGLEQATLKKAIKTLKEQLNNAEECVRINEKKVTNLDLQIQEADQSNQTMEKVDKKLITNNSSADLIYLTKERKKIADILAQCRLFSIRANEALDVYSSTLSRIKKEKILEHSKPFWHNVKLLFNKKITLTNKPLTISEIPSQILHPKILYIIIATGFVLSSLVFYKASTSSRIRRYIHLRRVHLSNFLLLFFGLTCLITTSYLSFIYSQLPNTEHLLSWVTAALSIYFLLSFVFIIFYNIKKVKAFFCWYSLDYKFFKLLTIFITTLYATGTILKTLAKQLNINNLIWHLGQSIFLYIELLLVIGIVFYFCHSHRQISFIKKYKTIIKTISTIMFLSFAIINLVGYNLLSIHLTISGIFTFALIFSTIILEQGVAKLYHLCTADEATRTKLQYIFGYKSEQPLTEILILKTTIQIIIILGAAYLITQSWGYALDSIDMTFKYILNGIRFGNFTFNPARIISGVIVFCILYLLFRSISTAISRHEQFDGEEETQVAVASIFTYIGFGVALISALLIAGFDFTGLAIVAGALSVGIGLGLQSIVNNFVSGIILLIEKPIRPGDKINIDGVEGFVKKIRVRSTQILTPNREDMIIPNSDLITRRVTNYMYSDKHLTVYCEMGVGYENDLDLVMSLLIDIASKHPEVITSVKNNKPRVFLRSFGESSIVLQLWFLIKDCNKKTAVRSEIYLEILKVFKENNIIIAYPQRDLHVKVSDIKTIKEIS